MRVKRFIWILLALPVMGGLRIDEICPQPTTLDANGCESGWVELVNDGDDAVNLADYELVVRKRGKKRGPQGGAKVNLAARRVVPAGGRTLVYTSEMYDNAEDYAGDGETVKIYANDLMVFPQKISPKKYPLVELYCGTNKNEKVLCDALAVPCDIPEGASLAHDAQGAVILPSPTPGAANELTGASAVGPEIGPLRGVKHDLSDHVAFPRATNGCDYAVSFYLNPPDSAFPEIAEVRLIYRAGFGAVTTAEVACVKGAYDAQGGQRWEGVIPAASVPTAGGLLCWAACVTDAAGRTFRAPSFRVPDHVHEWYGTIVAGGDLDSATLQTFHLFADSSALSLMDKQYDAIASFYPLGARCGVYDSVTGLYYDNVRIDLRGQTSASFKKKSHGLRFPKTQPLTCTDPVTGITYDGVRKTSFIAQFSDPACLRQALTYEVMRAHGVAAPNDYPVRLNLNGAFYQLAWNSNRFTDEYLEDIAGLDPLGYAWKGCGTLSGGGEKTLPTIGGDDATSVMSAWVSSFAGVTSIGESGTASELPAVTKAVVESFDLPAWLNYLAFARLTQQCDDVWANLCVYRDSHRTLPKKGGDAWTGTWMPLAYDNHLAWGAWYYNDDSGYGRNGCRPDDDRFKSHPFYGGLRVRCHKYNSSSTINSGNRGCEAVWQSPKFRRLYLRRLRTVMDAVLKAPGTSREDTPVWSYVTNVLAACSVEDALDHAKWGYGTGTAIWDWPSSMDMAAGVEDLWTNYIVPRRVHLYETHSVTNTTKGVGYRWDLSAGIPAAQSPLAALKDHLSVESCDGGVVIRNANDEAIDLTDWKVKGPVKLKLPAGTVIDQQIDGVPGEVFVVTNRLAFVTAHAAQLVDQVIVGNGKANDGRLRLEAADGTEVFRAKIPVSLTVDCRAGRDFEVAELAVTVADFEAESTLPLVVTARRTDGTIAAQAELTVASNGVYAVAFAGLNAGETYTFTAEVNEDSGALTLPLARKQVAWIDEDAETLTGVSSEKWVYEPETLMTQDGAIEVAVGLSAEPASFTPNAATGRVYTVTHRATFDAPGKWTDELEATKPRAAFRVVWDDADVCRFAFYDAAGWHTNTTVIAEFGVEYEIRVTFDERVHTVTYTLGDETVLGQGVLDPEKSVAPTALRYRGNGRVRKIDGAVYDVDVASANGVNYESVSNAVAAAGGQTVTLLHDASYAPGSNGVFRIYAGEYTLELVGGEWPAFAAWAARHADVFDGTRTIGAAGARLTAYLDLADLLDEQTRAALTQEDVRIDSVKFENGVVELALSVKGLTVGANVKGEDIRKVFTILGGEDLGKVLTAEEVTTVADPARSAMGGVTFKVKPAQSSPTRFFYRAVLK